MTAFLLGYGMRRERILAAGDVPTLAGQSAAANPQRQAPARPMISAGAEAATAAPPSRQRRQSESA